MEITRPKVLIPVYNGPGFLPAVRGNVQSDVTGKKEEGGNKVKEFFLQLSLLGGTSSAVAGCMGVLLLRVVPSSARTEWYLGILVSGLLGASLFVSWLFSPPRLPEERATLWCVVAACLAGVPYATVLTAWGGLPPEFAFGVGPLAALGGAALIIYSATDEICPRKPEKQAEDREIAAELLDPFMPLPFLSRLFHLLFAAVAFVLAAGVTTVTEILWPQAARFSGEIVLFMGSTLLGGGALGYSVWRFRLRLNSSRQSLKQGEGCRGRDPA